MEKIVLVYIVDNDKVLLAKKTHRVGPGNWHAFGGSVGRWDSLYSSAQSHVWKATGGVKRFRWRGPFGPGGIWIETGDLKKIGTIDVYEGDRYIFGHPEVKVTAFQAMHFVGQAVPTIKMNDSTWFSMDRIALIDIESIHELFLSSVNGTPITGWVRRERNSQEITQSSIVSCNSLDLVA